MSNKTFQSYYYFRIKMLKRIVGFFLLPFHLSHFFVCIPSATIHSPLFVLRYVQRQFHTFAFVNHEKRNCEGSNLPNCQTNLLIVFHELFGHILNLTFGPMEAFISFLQRALFLSYHYQILYQSRLFFFLSICFNILILPLKDIAAEQLLMDLTLTAFRDRKFRRVQQNNYFYNSSISIFCQIEGLKTVS